MAVVGIVKINRVIISVIRYTDNLLLFFIIYLIINEKIMTTIRGMVQINTGIKLFVKMISFFDKNENSVVDKIIFDSAKSRQTVKMYCNNVITLHTTLISDLSFVIVILRFILLNLFIIIQIIKRCQGRRFFNCQYRFIFRSRQLYLQLQYLTNIFFVFTYQFGYF